jgi:hypothetical protein
MLLARFMPNSVLHHEKWVFSVVPPHPRKRQKRIHEYSILKHNIFTSIGSTAYYTLDSSLTLTHLMGMHQNMNSRFLSCKKLPKASVHAIKLLPTLGKNLSENSQLLPLH